MKEQRLDLSLVLACYNEEAVLRNNVDQIIEVLNNSRITYEIIFVDDCSKDRTIEIINDINRKYPSNNFKNIFHEENKGRGRTVTDGFSIAQGDIVGYIDIDLEVHARYIPSHILAIQNGADIAVALRIYKFYLKSTDRYLASKVYVWLVRRMFKVPCKDTETGFKFFRRKKVFPILDAIDDTGWFWDTEFMVRSFLKGLKIVEIPCLYIRRFDKQSSVNLFRDTLRYLMNLWKFYKKVKGSKM